MLNKQCNHPCCGAKCRKVRAPKKRTPIRNFSTKREKLNREYRKITLEMMEKSDRCELSTPDCTGKMEGLDHLQKRSPSNLIKRENLKRSCNACNLWKERNPVAAKEMGISISRFIKL
jgi:5-methylcytosine-specific restriction endonuclease McrA